MKDKEFPEMPKEVEESAMHHMAIVLGVAEAVVEGVLQVKGTEFAEKISETVESLFYDDILKLCKNEDNTEQEELLPYIDIFLGIATGIASMKRRILKRYGIEGITKMQNRIAAFIRRRDEERNKAASDHT